MAIFERRPPAEAQQLESRIDRVDRMLEAERRRRRLDARLDAQRASQRGRG